MTTRAMVWSVVVAVAIIGTVTGAGTARGPDASGTCESTAARGCPMMGSPMAPPAGPGARPTAPADVGPSPESPRPAQPAVGSAERGRRIYLARCTACHSADPGLDGPVGPAVKGSPIGLVRARVLRAAYPPGYMPKRPTRVMPALPDLAPWIADLGAFLGAR